MLLIYWPWRQYCDPEIKPQSREYRLVWITLVQLLLSKPNLGKMTMSALSGYGRHTVVHKFDGDSTTFDTWVDRLCLTLERQQKDLSKVIAGEESITEDDNYQVYLTLCEHIKDEQFNLIKDNFKNKGREAFIHLKQHYKGSPDDIIYTSIKEASNMEKQQDEDITAYFGRLLRIRGALEACKLKLGEHFYLINAMKGLPEDYQAFCAILDTPKTRPATVTEFMSMSKYGVQSGCPCTWVQHKVNYLQTYLRSSVLRFLNFVVSFHSSVCIWIALGVSWKIMSSVANEKRPHKAAGTTRRVAKQECVSDIQSWRLY